jgi:hypothetical protein
MRLGIGANLFTADQVKRVFSSDVANKYVVVEVGIFPAGGRDVYVDYRNFALKTGETTLIRPDRPDDVTPPWPEKKGPSGKGPTLITDAGVICNVGTGNPGPAGQN